jgi:hypothetical protein
MRAGKEQTFVYNRFHDWTGFRDKTLWDWLTLLFVPTVLAMGIVAGFSIWTSVSSIENERALEVAKERLTLDRELLSARRSEDALQLYLERMSRLILEKGLISSNPGDPVRVVATAYTRSVLRQVSAAEKGLVVAFLYDSNLINGDEPIIDLSGADLTQADLSNVSSQ